MIHYPKRSYTGASRQKFHEALGQLLMPTLLGLSSSKVGRVPYSKHGPVWPVPVIIEGSGTQVEIVVSAPY